MLKENAKPQPNSNAYSPWSKNNVMLPEKRSNAPTQRQKWPTNTRKNTVPPKLPYLKNSNVIRHYFRKKKLTSSLDPEKKEITKLCFLTPLLPSLTAKF